VVLRSDSHPRLLLAACTLIFPWLVHCPSRFGFVLATCDRELKHVLVLAGWSGRCGSVLSFLVLAVCTRQVLDKMLVCYFVVPVCEKSVAG
jgi:hypothetical protein